MLDPYSGGFMQVKDIMTQGAQVINSQKTVIEAARMMADGDFGSLPVEENDKMIGMITDRDIAVRTVAQSKNPETTKVADCMTTGIDYCFDDDDLAEVTQKMKENQHRRIPVVNRQKRLVGILSLGDLAVQAKDKKQVEETLRAVSQPH
jgi:CBS domain-containing protein